MWKRARTAVVPDYFALLLLGLVSGATVCSVGCLAHLGPYLLGSAKGFREGLSATASYLAGKYMVYLLWGGVAGWAGSLFSPGDNGGSWLGFFLVVAGLLLPFFNHAHCPARTATLGNRGTLFGLGAVTSLMPCPTLLGLLAVAAASGSAAAGVGCGAAFALGLLCSPLLLIGGVLGMVAGRLRLEVAGMGRIFQGFAMLMLIGMGVRLLLEV